MNILDCVKNDSPTKDDILYLFSDKDGAPDNYSVTLESLYIGAEETIKDIVDSYYPKEVIIKCSSCGQWGAIKTACKYCGAPIE